MTATNTAVLTVNPLADRVVVRPLDEHDRTLSGLYIPETARERPQQGEILAVGAGRFEYGVLVPMSVKVGDRVLYGRQHGTEVTLEGHPCLILRESDIFAVVS